MGDLTPAVHQQPQETLMRVYSAVIERCPQTGNYVGFVPGSQVRIPRVRPWTS